MSDENPASQCCLKKNYAKKYNESDIHCGRSSVLIRASRGMTIEHFRNKRRKDIFVLDFHH
jgi:hypothetical protein